MPDHVGTLNRTNVELKLGLHVGVKSVSGALNRTNVELKYAISYEDITKTDLLIVPMWN